MNMKTQFMVKFAWKCNHENYGEILSFIVTPKVNTYANVYGYKLGKEYDEVIRFTADDPQALSILPKLARINSTQWSQPSFGDTIEVEFDLSDFLDQYFYQDNYGREVTFYTHRNCLRRWRD